MKLYYAHATISIATAIALEEAALPYEAVELHFAKAEQTKPEYLALNPKGRVPALVTDAGDILTETGALLEYIAALAPDANLIPKDPVDAAHMRSVMYYLASTMHVAHAHKMRGSRWADNPDSFEDMKAKVPQTMAACATYVEDACLKGDYVCGDMFTIADANLFVVCNWLSGDGVALTDYPKITGYLARMEARDSVKSMRERAML